MFIGAMVSEIAGGSPQTPPPRGKRCRYQKVWKEKGSKFAYQQKNKLQGRWKTPLPTLQVHLGLTL